MAAERNWAERYEAGRRDEVWRELRALGGSIRNEPEATEAQRVCDLMAHRALHNVEVIVDRLTEQQYRFHRNDRDEKPTEARHPPTERARQVISWLEQHVGPVPLTIRSWMLIVGDVWFVGTHPQWPESSAADPLVIQLELAGYRSLDIEAYLADEVQAQTEQNEDDEDLVLPVAPDRLHKANVSGGLPYGIVLPDAGIDATFVAESTVPFVDYLNHVFAHGGFPWPTSGAQSLVVSSLTPGLLPCRSHRHPLCCRRHRLGSPELPFCRRVMIRGCWSPGATSTSLWKSSFPFWSSLASSGACSPFVTGSGGSGASAELMRCTKLIAPERRRRYAAAVGGESRRSPR